MIIRAAREGDAAALAGIYGDACLHGLGTFEEAPPSPQEMWGRVSAVTERGLPYLVAEVDGTVAGFAYAAPFRLRAAYRYTVEDSVYIHPNHKGRGVGRALLSRVVEACEAMGLRQIMAVIGDSGNEGSIGLHRSLGFEMRGSMPAVGYKHGRWVDIVFMQRALNAGAESAPDAAGLRLHGH
ncbi:MAG TPA: GNAT family N-acetyltransferase [Caulobacteraceae bacterium]|nr:GNAT family N-acetyltransferase [Caulobacteraceae bacterium]